MESLTVIVGGHSESGKKEQNQDAFAVCIPHQPDSLHTKGIVACIADGASGSENSQQASHTAVTQFIDDYYCTPMGWSVKKSVSKVLSSLNAWLFHHSQHSYLPHHGFISTFSAVVLVSNTAHLFHIGDSRLYLFRHQQLEQLTNDHCIGYSNELTRSLGLLPNLEVDYRSFTLMVDDVLMLSTDGFHDFLTQSIEFKKYFLAALEDQRKDTQSQEDWIVFAKYWVTQALAYGATDNVTCLFVHLSQLPHMGLSECLSQDRPWVIPPALSMNHRLDDYRITQLLHSSPRSLVYEVEDTRTQKKRVLKALSNDLQDDPLSIQRFLRERWIGQQLSNPHLLHIDAQNTTSAFLYWVGDKIEGDTLSSWIRNHPMPSIELVIVLLASMEKGATSLHRLGMVHGDLKPENIMIQPNNTAVLIDFGSTYIDSLSEQDKEMHTTPAGAMEYSAPESWYQVIITPQSDVFSLALITYEMLSGSKPYKDDALASNRWDYQSIREHRSDIPPWIDSVLRKGCHPNAALRYTSISDFMNDLQRVPIFQGWKHQHELSTKTLRVWQGLTLMLGTCLIVSLWASTH